MANGALNTESEQREDGTGAVGVRATPRHDVRRKRLPALSFLLRRETLRQVARVVSLLVLDFAGIFGAIFTGFAVKEAIRGRFDVGVTLSLTRSVMPFAYLVTVLLFARANLYAERGRRPGLSRILSSLFQVTILALIFALATDHRFSSYYIFYGSLFFAVVYVATLRWCHFQVTGFLLRRAGYSRRTVLVGSGSHIEAVAHAMLDAGRPRIELVGYISLSPRPHNGLRSLGALDELPRILPDHQVQEVVIADPDFPAERAVQLVDECHRQGVRVLVAPSTMEILARGSEFLPGQAVPLFTLKPPVFEGFDYVVKRCFDLVLASVLVVLLAPVMLAIAAAVAIESRGPVLYRSIRAGIGEGTFPCLKFRTMRHAPGVGAAELEALNEASGPLFKIRGDPRITRVGRLLRRFSLDELPQLVNVLRGEMSLVGPRPLPMRDFARLDDWHKKRYLVLPGMTGLWQVSGRSELDFDDLVRLDFIYLERWSVFLDFVILLKTIPAVLSRRGAF